MRRQVFGLLVLVLVLLTACTSAPPQTVPQTKLGRLWRQVRYQPPATPTPQPGDRMCLADLSDHGDDLPDAVVEHIDGIAPSSDDTELWDAIDEAMHDADVTRSGISMYRHTSPTGELMTAFTWCSPYGELDVFVQDAEGSAWHVIHSASPAPLSSMWLGSKLLITQHDGRLVQTHRIWIVEPVDGEWVITYESSTQNLSGGLNRLPEITHDYDGMPTMRLKYTQDDGTQVDELYRFDGVEWVLTEEDNREEGN